MSLRELIRRVKQSQSLGTPLGRDEIQLGGITEFEGYYIDLAAEHGSDVILYGIHRPGARTLHLDDLSLILAAGGDPIYCSLDPLPKNILQLQNALKKPLDISAASERKKCAERLSTALGPQQVVVSAPRRSRVSRTQVIADYKMKQLSLGLAKLGGIETPEERLSKMQSDDVAATQARMQRLWFNFVDGAPKFEQCDLLVELSSCKTGVLTERQQASATGELQDDPSGQDDPDTENFTKQLGALLQAEDRSSLPAEFQDLVEMYRLTAIVEAVFQRKDFERTGLNIDFLTSEYRRIADEDFPNELPGLANVICSKEVGRLQNSVRTIWRAQIAVGGCYMHADLTDKSFASSDAIRSKLEQKRIALVTGAAGGAHQLWWTSRGP